MSGTRQCRKCGAVYPLNRENFGSNGSGGFRWQCRRCMAAASRKWAQENPDRIHVREQRRQARNQGFTITEDLKRRLLREQANVCALCGMAIASISKCDVDHLVPLARGGTNHESNLVAAHRQCNKEKAAKTLAEYRQWRQLNRLPASRYRSWKTDNALAR